MAAPASRPGAQAWARRRGRKMRKFLAHWWMRMALSQALMGWDCSVKVRTGVMPAEERAERRLAVGLATMGCWQVLRSGRSGRALPMYEKLSPKRDWKARSLLGPARLVLPSEA